jgi:hypothetical protein
MFVRQPRGNSIARWRHGGRSLCREAVAGGLRQKWLKRSSAKSCFRRRRRKRLSCGRMPLTPVRTFVKPQTLTLLPDHSTSLPCRGRTLYAVLDGVARGLTGGGRLQ